MLLLCKLMFNDETYFTLGGFVSKENCHICTEENRGIISGKSLAFKKLTIETGP